MKERLGMLAMMLVFCGACSWAASWGNGNASKVFAGYAGMFLILGCVFAMTEKKT